MEDNPYSALIGNIRKDIDNRLPTAFRIGRVSVGDPLTLEIAGTLQGADTLLKNVQLNDFQFGEQVLVLPIENEQRYIIVCKVVSV